MVLTESHVLMRCQLWRHLVIFYIIGSLAVGCGIPQSLPAASTMPVSCMPGPPGPYYPFAAPTRISEPNNRQRHITIIEQRDPCAHLFRNHRGLKIKESFFDFIYRDPVASEYRTISYQFNIPIENGRKIVRGTWYVADDTSIIGDGIAVRWADASVIDHAAVDTEPYASDSVLGGHDSSMIMIVKYLAKYPAWELTYDELTAILSMPEPVFIPAPHMTMFEDRYIAFNDIPELIINPNRCVDTSDTILVVNGILPDTISRTLAAALTIAALADPEVNEFDAATAYAKYRVPRQLRIVPPALKYIARRYNPIIYLYPYASDRILAKVGRSFFPGKDDPTVITGMFDGWRDVVVDIILVWDGSCWQGHRLAVISDYTNN